MYMPRVVVFERAKARTPTRRTETRKQRELERIWKNIAVTEKRTEGRKEMSARPKHGANKTQNFLRSRSTICLLLGPNEVLRRALWCRFIFSPLAFVLSLFPPLYTDGISIVAYNVGLANTLGNLNLVDVLFICSFCLANQPLAFDFIASLTGWVGGRAEYEGIWETS